MGLRINLSALWLWQRCIVADFTYVRRSAVPCHLEASPCGPMSFAVVNSFCAGGRHVETLADMKDAARDLHALGPKMVLVKGGHLEVCACPLRPDDEG